jgi:hypothetical protein
VLEEEEIAGRCRSGVIQQICAEVRERMG